MLYASIIPIIILFIQLPPCDAAMKATVIIGFAELVLTMVLATKFERTY